MPKQVDEDTLTKWEEALEDLRSLVDGLKKLNSLSNVVTASREIGLSDYTKTEGEPQTVKGYKPLNIRRIRRLSQTYDRVYDELEDYIQNFMPTLKNHAPGPRRSAMMNQATELINEAKAELTATRKEQEDVAKLNWPKQLSDFADHLTEYVKDHFKKGRDYHALLHGKADKRVIVEWGRDSKELSYNYFLTLTQLRDTRNRSSDVTVILTNTISPEGKQTFNISVLPSRPKLGAFDLGDQFRTTDSLDEAFETELAALDIALVTDRQAILVEEENVSPILKKASPFVTDVSIPEGNDAIVVVFKTGAGRKDVDKVVKRLNDYFGEVLGVGRNQVILRQTVRGRKGGGKDLELTVHPKTNKVMNLDARKLRESADVLGLNDKESAFLKRMLLKTINRRK